MTSYYPASFYLGGIVSLLGACVLIPAVRSRTNHMQDIPAARTHGNDMQSVHNGTAERTVDDEMSVPEMFTSIHM